MINNNVFFKSNCPADYFKACGSFGEVTGEIIRHDSTLINETDQYRFVCRYTKTPYGVYTRKDTFENISDKPIRVDCLKSVFPFDSGELEVYSQYNSWCDESMGGWQDLYTGIHLSAGSLRTSMDATPFIALWNRQNSRGCCFHLLPKCAWEITVKKLHNVKIIGEFGIQEYNFTMELQPGEIVELPEIIFYSFTNKTDTDCYKLHRYMNELYPRKALPVIYNSWLYCFDNVSYENIACQIPVAAELGVEYFVIDAGWFGDGGEGRDWANSVGDWEESTKRGFCGRMNEIATLVRENGMGFGLWFEPERADGLSKAVAQHRDWFLVNNDGNYLLDFANPEAVDFILDSISGIIEKYGVEYVKFDFNADLYYDATHTAFMNYHKGHSRFIQRLYERFPDLYITNCASGGARTNLVGCTEADSFWPSDNEGVYNEMRMFKETILRLPPQAFEKYTCIRSLENFIVSNYNPTSDRIIACNDATWYDITGVHESYLIGYYTGSPIGISCDLTRISSKLKRLLSEHITEVKNNREFWLNAECRILGDATGLTVYQYSDKELSSCHIVAFFETCLNTGLYVYPIVDPDKNYLVDDTPRLGADIMENGIYISVPKIKEAATVVLKEVK